MKVTVIGCGHLGATHAACMASIGHEVVGVDIDEDKVSLLNSGKAWFHEPRLDMLLADNIAAGRLRFTTDFAEAGRVRLMCTLSEWRRLAARTAATTCRSCTRQCLPWSRICAGIVSSSASPRCRRVPRRGSSPWSTACCRPGQGRVEVVWNPEFLREGCAVQDTLRPDRIVAGAASAAAAEIVRAVYRPLTDVGIPLLITDPITAELAKGAANAFLATKISFINAMADICAADRWRYFRPCPVAGPGPADRPGVPEGGSWLWRGMPAQGCPGPRSVRARDRRTERCVDAERGGRGQRVAGQCRPSALSRRPLAGSRASGWRYGALHSSPAPTMSGTRPACGWRASCIPAAPWSRYTTRWEAAMRW